MPCDQGPSWQNAKIARAWFSFARARSARSQSRWAMFPMSLVDRITK